MKKAFKPLYLFFTISLMTLLIFAGCASNSGPSDQGSDPDTPTLPDPTVNLFINQVTTQCLSAENSMILAYVSVIDEIGDPIDGLIETDFSITENGRAVANDNITISSVQEGVSAPISFSIIMDYSNSMQLDTAAQTAMEQAVLNFIELMRTTDQAEIIKFNNGIRLNTAFTSDKQTLRDAVATSVETGATYVYDTLYTGITHLTAQTGRKALVAMTDGWESHDTLYPGEGRTRDDVIELAQANGVPLFLIGLSSKNVNEENLLIMSEETKGHYYLAGSNAELSDIYASISALLNESQYLLEFEAPRNNRTSGNLTISVSYAGATDSASSAFNYDTSCQ